VTLGWRRNGSGRTVVVVALAAAILANIAAVAPTLGFRGLAWLEDLELGVFQRHLARTDIPANPEILLVSIDKETSRKLGLSRPIGPLPRTVHADLVTGLRDAGAKSLVLDILFMDEGLPEEDLALEAALEGSAPLPVTLASEPAWLVEDPDAPTGWRSHFPPPVVLPDPPPPNVRFGSARPWDPDSILRGAVLIYPNQPRAAGPPGATAAPLHPAGAELLDAIPEWTTPPAGPQAAQPIYHLALSCVLGRHGIAAAHWDRRAQVVVAGPFRWPVGQDGEMLVRYAARDAFERLEYADALTALRSEQGRAAFKDRIVIVGAGTGDDIHRTDRGEMHGLDFVAHMVNTLLDRSPPVTRWSIPANFCWSLLLALGAAGAIRSLDRRVVFVGVGGSAGAALLLPALAAPAWIDTVCPALAVVLAVVLGGLHSAVLAGRFAPAHVRRGRPQSLTDTATVMFVDLQGSTKMSERLGPERAQRLQGKLLEVFSRVVVGAGGEVERTLGDGLMAVFHRARGEEHALRCLGCVPPLLDAARRLDEEWSGEPAAQVRVTIGVESGVVSGAVIRTAEREEWSSFGPTVNLAARLQGACGGLGVSVLVGPGATALARQAVDLAPVGRVALRGFTEPIEVYSLAEKAEG
jgi:adenylate cyclase